VLPDQVPQRARRVRAAQHGAMSQSVPGRVAGSAARGPAAGRLPTSRRAGRAAGLVGVFVIATLLAGTLCGAAAASTPTGTTRRITVPRDGVDRTAVVHHPAAARAGAPLVVVLHGAGGSSADVRTGLGWDGLADRAGFVMAYPDGLDHTWNAGACCGGARDRRVDDVGFLDGLVATVRDADHTGPVYAVGFSNGAMMTYAWACARPGALAGIGPVAGALVAWCPSPSPLTVVAVHGAADDRVPVGGGRGVFDEVFPSLDASLAPFRAAAACPAAAPAGTRAAPPAHVDSRDCADGRRVVSDVVDGLPHAWPGAGPNAGTSDGPLDATGFLWARLRG
jgi:polyhydroxybutyrate depolymerase